MKEQNIYSGIITALITPFKEGKIDYNSLEKLINFQIESGIEKLVIAGSTGEGSSLNEEDYYDLIKGANQLAEKKVGIIAGVTAVSTDYAISKVKKLGKLDIDGIMVTIPHYIRPEQNGILAHFKAVNDVTDLPLIAYIHPGRTGVDLSDESIIRLSELKQIIALKDAGGNVDRALRLSSKLPSWFNMLTGDDANTLAYSANGGRGCISVAANILPAECLQLQRYLELGNYSKALILQQSLLPLYKAIFAESNPIGVKYAAHLLGLCEEEIKLPLTIASATTKIVIRKVLEEYERI